MRDWIGWFGLVLLWTGCDPLSDEQTEGPSLATLRGTLSLAPGVSAPGGTLQVSVLWQDPGIDCSDESEPCEGDEQTGRPTDDSYQCGDGQLTGWRYETRLLEQPVQFDTAFPSTFSVSLTEPPPSAAMFDDIDGHGTSGAIGDLVVYDDRNGNHRLDPRTAVADSPDEVLASSEGTSPSIAAPLKRYTITYLSADLDSPDSTQFGDGKAGYSLTTFDASPAESRTTTNQRLSDATIELVLQPNPELQQSACTALCDIVSETLDCPSMPGDIFNRDLGVRLLPDIAPGSSTWLRQADDKRVLTVTSCTHEHVAEGSSIETAYVFEIGISTTEGCQRTRYGCIYKFVALTQEDVELPCTQYREYTPSTPDMPE